MERLRRVMEETQRMRERMLLGPLWGRTLRFDDGGDPPADPPSDPPSDPPADPEPKPDPTLLESAGVPLVDKDGKFTQNWRDHLPEEIRDAENLKNYQDLPNLAKALVNAQKLVGKNKVALPGENASDEEKRAYYTAIGCPEKPDAYKFEIPEDLKDIFSEQDLKETAQFAWEIGATQKQVDRFMKHQMERAVALVEMQDQLDKQAEIDARRTAEETLRKEFGGAYDERIHIANRIVAEAFPKEEERMDFLQKYGNDPNFVKFASVIGARLSESKAVVAQLTQETPRELDKRISDLQKTPGYFGPYRNAEGKMVELSNEDRQAITEQIRELEKQKHPNPAQSGLMR